MEALLLRLLSSLLCFLRPPEEWFHQGESLFVLLSSSGKFSGQQNALLT